MFCVEKLIDFGYFGFMVVGLWLMEYFAVW